MSLIWVTGISGSGKSEVRKKLRERGYTAYGTDEDEIGAFYDRETGAMAARPDRSDPKWRAKHAWKARRDKVAELADEGRGGRVFLCGTVENEREVWDLFSQVIALVIDDATLRRRISSRTNNNFGQNPDELRKILTWQKTVKEDYVRFGAIIVDATLPIDVVVDTVLESTA